MPLCDYIAIDWGTTNRRIFLMRGDGTVAYTQRDDCGVMRMQSGDYPRELALIRKAQGALPVLASGMVGSSRGWLEVPYCHAPASIADLAANLHDCGDDIFITPGIATRAANGCDVMRGEEVQVLGALVSGSVSEGTVFCQPGTHNKWIDTEGVRIASFATAMTGELFALLKEHSVLSEMLVGPVANGPAFLDGLERGMGADDLLTALFQSRAAALLGQRPRDEIASYVSGLLIGSDVGSRRLSGRQVALLASGELSDLYRTAIEAAGAHVLAVDSHVAFATGIHAIHEAM